MITTELIPPSPVNWNRYGSQLLSIEQEVWAEKAFDEEMMEADINDPKAILIILKDEETIIGFTYALPRSELVSCIVNIVIMKNYQKKGLVKKLMEPIESELRKNGYVYMVECAMVDNGYADKIKKNYHSRIIESKDVDSEYGRQTYFKILL